MTLSQMSLKVWLANLRRSLLYFLCNSFTITVVFAYSTLLTNSAFMNRSKVDSMKSSNLIGPSYVVALFAVIFLCFTQQAFLKSRKPEYGLFMLLGMTRANIRKLLLFEQGLLALASLLAGLLSGVVFSWFFHLTVTRITGLNDISFVLSARCFFYTALFFLLIHAILVTMAVLSTYRYNISELLKESKTEEGMMLTRWLARVAGLAAVGGAIGSLLCRVGRIDADYLLVQTALGIAGLYFLLSALAGDVLFFLRKFPNVYCRNLLFLSNLKYSYGQSKNIVFLIGILIGTATFFCSLSFMLTADAASYARQHHPYDLAYTEVYGKNKLSDDEINKIVLHGDSALVTRLKLDYIDLPAANILSASEIKDKLGVQFDVEHGSFVDLFQIVEGDGYAHDTTPISQLRVKTTNGEKIMVLKDSAMKLLFNPLRMLQNSHTVILSPEDYQAIRSSASPASLGSIHLFSFQDWRKTKNIVGQLDNELQRVNADTKPYFENKDQDTIAFLSSSRIGEYMLRKQSGGFSLFLFSFVAVLFYAASAVLLHFRLLSRLDKERDKYRKIAKVGISKKEVYDIVSKELRLLFFFPYIIGFLLAVYSIDSILDHEQWKALRYTGAVSLMYLILQTGYYLLYKVYYLSKLTR